MSIAPAPRGIPGNEVPIQTKPIDNLEDIKFVSDLRKIEARHLRSANMQQQISKIKEKILFLAQANKLFAYQVMADFQQSPLFQSYLAIGQQLLADPNVDRKAAYDQVVANLKSQGKLTLSLPEFEAVADLKSELERM